MAVDLIQVRKGIKSAKPVFLVQDSNKRKEITGGRWRRPKGMHSKMRLNKSGNPKTPSQGYRSPRMVRHLSPEGLKPVFVTNVGMLSGISGGEGVLVPSPVGMKKRTEIVKAAVEKKLPLLNIDADRFLKSSAALLDERRKRKAARLEKKQPEHAPVVKKQEPEAPVSGEDRRKAEKEEMEKVITKPK